MIILIRNNRGTWVAQAAFSSGHDPRDQVPGSLFSKAPIPLLATPPTFVFSAEYIHKILKTNKQTNRNFW